MLGRVRCLCGLAAPIGVIGFLYAMFDGCGRILVRIVRLRHFLTIDDSYFIYPLANL